MSGKPALLFLTQRIPYPPNKGEKIRSLRILRHLCERYDVHLGCLVDDPADAVHIPAVAAMCASSHFATLDRRRAKVTCLRGLLTGEPLSVTFFRDRGLQQWVRATLRERRPDVVFISSSNIAAYVLDDPTRVRVHVCDFVDVDSEKWRAYAASGHPVMRLVHHREWKLTARLEARIARAFDWSVFVSPEEAALFRSLVPEAAPRIRAIVNGVDTIYFDPLLTYEPVFDSAVPNYVFTGTMDYPPNIDAVQWFAHEVLPVIRASRPDARFHVVGSNPAPSVQALAALEGVFVTGRVPDVRPYVAQATAGVAPMRIARGIQNKVLEAMAMARPVVVTPDALEGIDAKDGQEVLIASEAAGFAEACLQALRPEAQAIGDAARRKVLADYVWAERMRGFDALLAEPGA